MSRLGDSGPEHGRRPLVHHRTMDRHYGRCAYQLRPPFMGRYRSVADPAATEAVACHLQAPNRLHVAEAAWIASITLVRLGTALRLRARRHKETRWAGARWRSQKPCQSPTHCSGCRWRWSLSASKICSGASGLVVRRRNDRGGSHSVRAGQDVADGINKSAVAI
jgi:hypothetical protein